MEAECGSGLAYGDGRGLVGDECMVIGSARYLRIC